MTRLATVLPAAVTDSSIAAFMATHLHLLLPMTLITAVFSVMFQLALTALVIQQRLRTGIHLLDGGHASLTRRIRAHANFTETVPMALKLACARMRRVSDA